MNLSEFIKKLQELEAQGHGNKRVTVEEFVIAKGCTCNNCEERADLEVYCVDEQEEYNSSRVEEENRKPEMVIRICHEL